MKTRMLIASGLAAAVLTPFASAQTAAERAAVLKQWKADCASEDPDLRLAYVEDAIVNQGATVARICARIALGSDDPDARALGIRAALAMTDVLILPFDMPFDYQTRMQAAVSDDDDDEIERINEDYKWVKDLHEKFGGAYAFKQVKVDMNDATTEWIMKSSSGKFSDRNEAVMTVTSNAIRIQGAFRTVHFTAELQVGDDGLVTGEVMHSGKGPFLVAGELL